MALHREIDGSEPLRPEPIESTAGQHELRRTNGTWHMANGTLACPSCDAPALPSLGLMAPADPLSCGYCDHRGHVRDFLSLAEPTRPTRVAVRVRGLAFR